ncbi:hypothetical protein [Nitratireductor mangrovi]|nr:hypothetical protein [Nitratireductor mangrovi]
MSSARIETGYAARAFSAQATVRALSSTLLLLGLIGDRRVR